MRCSSFLRVADGEVAACAVARPVAAGSAAAAMMAAPLIKTLRRDGPAFPGDFCRVIALSLIFAANRSRDPQDGVPPGSMHHTIMEWLLDLHEVAGGLRGGSRLFGSASLLASLQLLTGIGTRRPRDVTLSPGAVGNHQAPAGGAHRVGAAGARPHAPVAGARVRSLPAGPAGIDVVL